MLTNVFRIGGFQTVSWFQLVPEVEEVQDETGIVNGQGQENARKRVLEAHFRLQKEGQLSSWSYTDAALDKGLKKAVLWVFFPGWHGHINPALHSVLSGLHVAKAGNWHCPGESSELTEALCQALCNRLERSLGALAYTRFGDIFVKCKRSGSQGSNLGKSLPTCQMIFTANEDAIFLHVLVHIRRLRLLTASDIRTALSQQIKHPGRAEEKLAVIVAPYGLHGWLTGCCPGDLVHQIYESKLEAPNGPYSPLLQCAPRAEGRSWYVEVSIAPSGVSHQQAEFVHVGANQSNQSNAVSRQNSGTYKEYNFGSKDTEDTCPVLSVSDQAEKVFIYPPEAVLVPMSPPISTLSYLKRCWLQRWAGTNWIEDTCRVPFDVPYGVQNTTKRESLGLANKHKSGSSRSSSSSSSGSGDSSIKSSSSRDSSGSESDIDDGHPNEGDDRADADSFISKNENLGSTTSSKRGRPKELDTLSEVPPKMSRSSPCIEESALQGATNKGLHPEESSFSKGAGSQVGASWDWIEDDRLIGLQSDADIFAEFGDFGDFFEDEGLGFGEPPGTAESQAYMLPLDCGESANTPGTFYMDSSDPMLLPILDFPLEGFSQPQNSDKDQKCQEQVLEDLKCNLTSSPISAPSTGVTVPREEAMLLFPPDYTPVDITVSQDSISKLLGSKGLYVPDVRRRSPVIDKTDSYTYNANPPATPNADVACRKTEPTSHASSDNNSGSKKINTGNAVLGTKADTPGTSKLSFYRNNFISRSVFASLATDVDCALHLMHLHQMQEGIQRKHDTMCMKDDLIDGSDGSSRPLDQKKKELIPVRIAGDVDEEPHDGPRATEIGVWRSVGAPKTQKVADNFANDMSKGSINVGTGEVGTRMRPGENGLGGSLNGKLAQWHEVLDGIPLLIQQASVSNDISLTGLFRDGPTAWMSYQDHLKNQSSQISAVAGARHFFDCPEDEIADVLSSEASPATVACLMQSELRQAIAAAFGEGNVLGPLALNDWCRGKVRVDPSISGDNYAAGGVPTDSKDPASSITVAVGEPITPPQCSGPSNIKQSIIQDLEIQRRNHGRMIESSSEHGNSEEGKKRITQDVNHDIDNLSGSLSHEPTIASFPVPALLVGYQDDWLKTSSTSLHLWEKAPLEPYAYPKPVIYFVLCPGIDALLSASFDFFQQLSTVYETCRLGTHSPSNVVIQTLKRRPIPGFISVDIACKSKQASSSSCQSLAYEYISMLESGWSLSAFRKALRKLLKSLPISGTSLTVQRDFEHTTSTVVYVICPSSEPSVVLKTTIDACQGLGSFLASQEREKKSGGSSNSMEEGKFSNSFISGFVTARIALQILTPDVIFKAGSPMASSLDAFKEVAFSVYNKIRRIPQKFCSLDSSQLGLSKGRTMSTTVQQTGIWKDCSSSRSTRESLLEIGSIRSGGWDASWSSSKISDYYIGDINKSSSDNRSLVSYAYEPLFILAENSFLESGSGQLLHSILHDQAGAIAEERTGSTQCTPAHGSGLIDNSLSVLDELDADNANGGNKQAANFHCCYAWANDWQWLVSVWTDARGEMLDIRVFRAGSQKEGKDAGTLFMQVLQQGMQLLSLVEENPERPRNLIISRVGYFYEVECQEWQKAIMALGGDEVKRWPVQIINMSHSNPSSAQAGRALGGSLAASPSAFASRTVPHGLSTMGRSMPLLDGQKSTFQLIQSISLVTVAIDHSLQIVCMNEASGPVGSQVSAAGTLSGSSNFASSSALGMTGLSYARTLSSNGAAYAFIPSHRLHYLDCRVHHNVPVQQAGILKLLQSKGVCHPIASGFVISGSASAKQDAPPNLEEEEWPSTLYIGLVGYLSAQAKTCTRQGSAASLGNSSPCDKQLESQCILEVIAAEMYALSWLTTSPLFLSRRVVLPFHCDVAHRLSKLLCYMNDYSKL